MQTSVTFKNLKPSEDLKNFVQSKLDRFDKYLDNPAEANVVLSTQKFRHIAEINITGDRLNIVGREETEDTYASISFHPPLHLDGCFLQCIIYSPVVFAAQSPTPAHPPD